MKPAETRARLRAAIVEACRLRGDTDAHKAALLDECLRSEDSDQEWLLMYFERIVSAWQDAGLGKRP